MIERVFTVIFILIAGLIALLISDIAHGHTAPSGWDYDHYCCHGNDCAVIKPNTVNAQSDGYHVNLKPGDHPLITEPMSYVIPYRDVKESKDDDYHFCIWSQNSPNARCFYAPPMSF